MKRAAAIIGSTPAHLRWALGINCPWRRADHRSVAESTARQLRIPQEFAIARRQNRIFDGWCFRDTIPLTAKQEVWGFNVSETLRPFGGLDHLASTCHHCPANAGCCKPLVSNQPNTESEFFPSALAGCFGWVRDTDDLGSMPNSANHCVDHWSRQFEMSIDRIGKTGEWSEAFIATAPLWFGIWCRSPLNSSQLDLLCEIGSQWPTENVPGQHTSDWQELFQAIGAASRESLPLHVEWVNAGHSDGVHWRLPGFCPNCRAPREENNRVCVVCGNAQVSEPSRIRKVLGLRPYIDLRRVLGESAAYDLHRKFLQTRAHL